jgi:hypothetical protein
LAQRLEREGGGESMIQQIFIISLCIHAFRHLTRYISRKVPLVPSFNNPLTQQQKDSLLLQGAKLERDEIINKELFWWIRWYGKKFLEFVHLKWLVKPVFECQICMAGPYGTIGYFVLNYGHWNILNFAITILAVAGANKVLQSFN